MNYKSNLAYAAFDEIPEAKSNALEIKALIKEKNKTVGYLLSDDSRVTKEKAITLAQDGMIRNVGIAHNKENLYLKALPDSNNSNNLSYLPSIK